MRINDDLMEMDEGEAREREVVVMRKEEWRREKEDGGRKSLELRVL